MPAIPALSGSLADRILALVLRTGTPEEKRVAERHGAEIKAFLEHPDAIRMARQGLLDLGIENRPHLKLNLMATGPFAPWGLLDEWAGRFPSMVEPIELVLRHKLRCHVGLKATPTAIEFEIYPYDNAAGVVTSLYARHRPEQSGLPAPILCYGCSSTGALSAYAEIKPYDPQELIPLLGTALPVTNLSSTALFNSRLSGESSWKTDKAGIEFAPAPSHLLNAVLGRMQLNFSYLLHRGGVRRYLVVGIHGPRQVLYTTLLPLPPRKSPASNP